MTNKFRDQFKLYKRKESSLIKNELKISTEFNRFVFKKKENDATVFTSSGDFSWEKSLAMKNPKEWEIYEITRKPGLIMIKNPFHFVGQRYWIVRCLKYYTRKPSKLNIPAHDGIDLQENWWDQCQRLRGTQAGLLALEKLRWATLGYHHNWDTKKYSESSRCEFPADLKILCKKIGEVLNFSNFNAEAAIINMYNFKSTLSGHVDESELNLSAPLFSFSFGQSAVFLIGGKTLDEECVPLLIESGDIIIMSGDSRTYYHGIPRIFPAENHAWNPNESDCYLECNEQCLLKEITETLLCNESWEPFDSYCRKCRINMNVRQVLFSQQSSLNDISVMI